MSTLPSAKKSGKGRPSVDSEAVNVRLERPQLSLLDDWRRNQPDLPTRPEAIRRLIEPRAAGGEGGAGEATLTDAAHRYRPGDRVIFHAPTSLPQFAGAYVIERLLPNSDDGPHYLIKRVKDGHERVASARELAPVAPATSMAPRRRTRRTSRRS